jgi:biotin carboxyl carrier protein
MLRFAGGPGIRVDTGVEEGDDIAPQFDSMIAKVIVTGADRREAVARMRRALDQSAVVIEGGTTNKAFLQGLLERPEFHTGDYDIGWIDRLVAEGSHVPRRHAEPAMLAAAITAYDEAVTVSIGAYTASAARGRPEVEGAIGYTVHLRHHGEPYAVMVRRLDPVSHRLVVDGHAIDVDLQRTGTAGRLSVAGTTHRFVSTVHAGTHVVEVDGIPHRFIHDEGGVIRAPSPAVVVAIPVGIGDRVEPGDRLAVVEAMKMETAVTSPVTGIVRHILVRANQQVTTGEPLVTIDINANGGLVAGSGERLDFSRLASADAAASHRGCRSGFANIRRSLLGFDVDPADLAGSTHPGCCTDTLDVDERRRLSEEVLAIFADVAGLFRRRPADGDEEAVERRSFQEHLFDFLKDSTRRGEGLPPAFLEQLRRCFAHHGPEAVEPGPRMESALYRLQVAHERMDRAVPVMLEVLEDRLEHPGHPGDEAFRSLLTRLIGETRHAYPALHDLAREVHYRTFDHPFLEGVRREAFAVVDDHLDHLQRDPGCGDRAERIEALVACPQALVPRLAARFVGAAPEVRRMLLEVTMRRYYRIRGLADIRTADVEGLPVASARYELDAAMVHVVATRLEWERLAEGTRRLSGALARIDPDSSAVVDVYVWRPDGVGDAAAIRTEIQQVLTAELGHLGVRRVVVTVTGPTSAAEFGLGGVLHCTFRPDGAGGYREDTLYRDLHPMMAKRLELWRLENFDLTRLTTLEDIYLFHGVAKANPRDERLFAVAEVRDVTALRDEQGRITSIPELERVFHEVVGSMRRFQARRPPDRRLVWNRILLYVWPEIEIDHQEIERMVQRLAPDAAGIGLQKVVVLANLRAPDTGETRRVVLEAANAREGTFRIRARKKAPEAIKPLSDYRQKVVRLRARGLTYPYELVRLLAPGKSGRDGFPPGTFVEYDLVDGALQPVDRPRGENRANVVVGLMSSHTARYPEGMRRVAILGDPSRGMGNLAEPECARIIAALDLAEGLGVPLEWFAVSAGALIAMDSGTENMDWIARVLRRLIEFTQAGGEMNVVVTGINVGAQPYWNAEATMLMHTKGILVMTPEGAMVLTGKEALDYSGGVSAEDNQGIGGYERIMGPNGQAQYFASDLTEACRILLRHYEHSYVAPGERFSRRATTSDPSTAT